MDTVEKKNLIRKAKNGDAHSFGILYSLYAKELYRFAKYTLKNSDDAEDAVQNACIQAFGKLGTLRNEDSFKTWFFKILYNECRKITVSKAKVKEVPCEDVSLYDSDSPDVSSGVDMMSLLDGLSEKEKAVIILSVFDGYTSYEIADILGMKPGTVRSSLSRLLNSLRKQIEGAENE